jgi:hypothetical protein
MSGGTEQIHDSSVRIADLCAEKRTPNLHNTKLAVYSVSMALNEKENRVGRREKTQNCMWSSCVKEL